MSEVKRYMRRSPDTGVLGSGFGLSDYVLASDYDRDTQALRAEIERYIQEGIKIADQRDALRAQIEVMRALLGECRDFTDTMQWPQRLRGKIDAAIQDNKP